MSCRYDREAEDYLNDGQPCRVDDYGDPTKHCTARRSCSQHIGRDELTCARCIGRVRAKIRRIVSLTPLMLTQALRAGIDSDAANLAGPATDVRHWTERRLAMRTHLLTWERLGRITEKQYFHARATMEDDDEDHPYTVLTRWHMMLAEDYGHWLPDRMSVTDSAAYLDRNLGRVAQDPEQDFPLIRREITHCAEHLEAVIRNQSGTERGAPCPDCRDAGRVVRMRRVYGHWCDHEECEQIHYADDSGDVWVCPVDRGHWMTPEGYAQWLKTRMTRPAASA